MYNVFINESKYLYKNYRKCFYKMSKLNFPSNYRSFYILFLRKNRYNTYKLQKTLKPIKRKIRGNG